MTGANLLAQHALRFRRLATQGAATRMRRDSAAAPIRSGLAAGVTRRTANRLVASPKKLHPFRRSTSTLAAEPLLDATEAVPPTREQLRNHFLKSAVPMIAFGFMDQTVMLQAGHAIDCTLGVTFGLSTLTAAAFGQVCSDAAGVTFGGTVESVLRLCGLNPKSNFTTAQRSLPIVKRVAFIGQLIGVIIGCCLGLVNLLLIDTERSSTLKLQALSEEQEFAFEVEASNALREDATVLTVRGPDVDGLLASMTAALTAQGCSLKELHASSSAAAAANRVAASIVKENSRQSGSNKEVSLSTTVSPGSTPSTNSSSNDNGIEDTFVVVKTTTKEQVPDEELDELAAALLEATFQPVNVRSFQAHAKALEDANLELKSRIHKLEKLLYDRQITIIPGSALMATSSSESIGGGDIDNNPSDEGPDGNKGSFRRWRMW